MQTHEPPPADTPKYALDLCSPTGLGFNFTLGDVTVNYTAPSGKCRRKDDCTGAEFCDPAKEVETECSCDRATGLDTK
jgi:hypothetical protein